MVLDDTSTARGCPPTITVLGTGGLADGASGREGDTTCTIGESLEGDGVDAGEMCIPGDVLDTGEGGNCVLEH